LVSWLFGYLVIWLFGYLVSWLFGYFGWLVGWLVILVGTEAPTPEWEY
jgi:hypothetical protein